MIHWPSERIESFCSEDGSSRHIQVFIGSLANTKMKHESKFTGEWLYTPHAAVIPLGTWLAMIHYTNDSNP